LTQSGVGITGLIDILIMHHALPEITAPNERFVMKSAVYSSLILAIGALTPTQSQAQVVWNTLPGEFAIHVVNGDYVTAQPIGSGPPGDRPEDFSITTDQVGGLGAFGYQKFRLAQRDPSAPQDKSIQTSYGRYLTAVPGDGLHADAKQVNAWEQFQLIEVLDWPQWFAIQTIHGTFLTALGGGGKDYLFGDPFHTDATQINAWERFRLVKCGDLGSGYQYTIVAGTDSFDPFLYAQGGGGAADSGNLDTIRLDRTENADNVWLLGWPKFRFIRQGDGSYALQTPNGSNFVTALGGGGKVEKLNPADGSITKIFHTDATQVQAWERFKITEIDGSCWYYMQTVSGKYVGLVWDQHTPLLSTDLDEGQYIQLIPHDLNYHSPAPPAEQ
jgi:hypothetical protein